jgi:WD40 repeat protein
MERVLSYSGGPALLLYEGKMLVIASGALLVLIDVNGSASSAAVGSPGLWRAFKSFAAVGEAREVGAKKIEEGENLSKSVIGCEQAFLKGHTAPIGLLETSPDGALMVSAETCANGNIFIWNIKDGKRIASLKPHSESVTAVGFNEDCSLLVTAGIYLL